MYRDVEAITAARVERLRAEVGILRAQDTPPRLTELRSELRRNRRDIVRARRALVWLRHPVLRLVPRSIVEIVCSAGIAYAAILSAGLGTLIVYTLVLPLLG
jgi:hypothetical protein